MSLGRVLARQGRLDEAMVAWRQALAIQPDMAEAHANLSRALKLAGRTEEAAAACRKAIALQPDLAEAPANLGEVLFEEAAHLEQLGCLTEAEAAQRRLHALFPRLPGPLLNLGRLLARQGRLDEAIAAWRNALAIQPDMAEAHANLGGALKLTGRLEEAAEACRKAVALKADLAEAHSNLGEVLRELGRLAEAADACRRAIAIRPDYAEAHVNLGAVLSAQGRLDEAADTCQQATRLNPSDPKAWKMLSLAHGQLGDVEEAENSFERAIGLDPGDPDLFRNLLSVSVYRDDIDSERLRQLHQRFGTAFARPFKALSARDTSPSRRLRIGYLSSDLRGHPVAGNLLPVLRHHDRQAFSLHFYAHVRNPDETTAEFRAQADGWQDIVGLDDEAVAARIRADGIDILVSLAGRLDDNRPQVCAWRAAPIQVSMHDVATSGLAEMDYIIGDRWLLPRRSDEFFTERPLRLPFFYIAEYPGDLASLATAREPGPVSFSCFNNPTKITPTTLALWGKILAALPQAVLVLKYRQDYQSGELRARFLKAMAAEGADAGQVRFVTEAASFADLMGLYNQVDVALDPFPFSGSTTTFQALSMGVPVVTWPWDRMASRWTASMLHALDLDGLIAGNGEEYVRIAVETAQDAHAWRLRRGDIRARLENSALCAPARWARHLERLYRAMWRRYCSAAFAP